MTSLLQLRDEFLKGLRSQASRRGEYADSSDWIEAERALMLGLINQKRLGLGKHVMDVAAVIKAERLCSGHVDYAEKFALYCAELVLEQP